MPPLPVARPQDKALLPRIAAALRATQPENCPMLTSDDASDDTGPRLEARLSDTQLLVSALCWRAAYNEGHGFWVVQGQQFYEIFFRFDTRASGLLAGALLAALLIEKPHWIERLQSLRGYTMWFVLAVPLIMELKWDDHHAMIWGITVVECAALVVLLAVQKPAGLVYEMLTAPLLIQLGKLSYGIYLWHYPVVRYLRADYSWPVTVVAGLLISTALSALSFYTVERWALRYRDAGRKPAPQRKQEPTLREATRGS